jgi:hypothetical protein
MHSEKIPSFLSHLIEDEGKTLVAHIRSLFLRTKTKMDKKDINHFSSTIFFLLVVVTLEQGCIT